MFSHGLGDPVRSISRHVRDRCAPLGPERGEELTQNRVVIRAVDSAKATRFIQSRVDDTTRWQPVLNTITNHPGGTLAVGLSTPWRLALATTVYEQRTPETGTYLRDPVALTQLGATSPEQPYPDHRVQLVLPSWHQLPVPPQRTTALPRSLPTATRPRPPLADDTIRRRAIACGWEDH